MLCFFFYALNKKIYYNKKGDNEPGMYDLINNTFYTNTGTGTFIVGNDVN